MRKAIFTFVLVACVGAMQAFAQQDFSKVEMKVQKVAGTVYMLQGAGGNIGASVGDDGIVVDVQFRHKHLKTERLGAFDQLADTSAEAVFADGVDVGLDSQSVERHPVGLHPT